jgi:membrane protease YdiL (CAAX protease family)
VNIIFDTAILLLIINCLEKLASGIVKEIDIVSEASIFEIVIFMPIVEELLFRGLPILFTNNIFHPVFIISHLIFVYAHKDNFEYGFVYVTPSFIISSVGLAYLAVEYDLKYAILAHIINNTWCVVFSFTTKREQV